MEFSNCAVLLPWHVCTQYPAIFILIILTGLVGFLQPYKRLFSNLLDVVLSVITLTMLLLRNTDTVLEELQKVRSSSFNETKEEECRSSDGLTDMVALLSVLYYIPLVVFLTAAGVWLVLVAQ